MTDTSKKPTFQNFSAHLGENRYKNVKESFKALRDLIARRSNLLPRNAKVLDVGCATGALISFLSASFPDYHFTGCDFSEELLGPARDAVPEVQFVNCNALELPAEFKGKFDLIIQSGVLGVFEIEDGHESIRQLLSAGRSGSLIYVFSHFNEFDVDVNINHRKYKGETAGDWETGWSIYSQRTIRHWLDGEANSVEFIDFEMPFPLGPQNDPVRTWTIDTGGSSLRLTNGLKLLVDLKFLEIIK